MGKPERAMLVAGYGTAINWEGCRSTTMAKTTIAVGGGRLPFNPDRPDND